MRRITRYCLFTAGSRMEKAMTFATFIVNIGFDDAPEGRIHLAADLGRRHGCTSFSVSLSCASRYSSSRLGWPA